MTDTSSLNLQSGSILFSEDGQSLISTQFKITNLTDVDIANLNHGSGTVKFLGVGSGSSTVTFQDTSFTGLKDTPSSYSGEGGKAVKVNSGETGLEFGALGSTQTKISYVTRDMTAANGTQAVTGVGFQPDVVIFEGVAGGYAGKTSHSHGFDDGTNHECNLITVQINAGSHSSGYSIFLLEDGSNYQRAYISSMDADGFTLTWDKQGSPASGTGYVTYMALKF